MKTPKQYRAPLQKRSQIEAWLSDAQGFDRRAYDYKPSWLFCRNVKLHGLDLSFKQLIKRATETAIDECKAEDAVWLKNAEEAFGDVNSDNLYSWAVEDAASAFIGRDCVPDDDGNNMLWDGTPVDVKFQFMGRSSGWLVLTHFNGCELNRETDWAEWSYKDLRTLYRYLVQLAADTTREKIVAEVEYKAAFNLFVNCFDKTQILGSAEVAERAHWEARDTVTSD